MPFANNRRSDRCLGVFELLDRADAGQAVPDLDQLRWRPALCANIGSYLGLWYALEHGRIWPDSQQMAAIAALCDF